MRMDGQTDRQDNAICPVHHSLNDGGIKTAENLQNISSPLEKWFHQDLHWEYLSRYLAEVLLWMSTWWKFWDNFSHVSLKTYVVRTH